MHFTATMPSAICATPRQVTRLKICRRIKPTGRFRRFAGFTARSMKRTRGSPRPHLASSVRGKMLVDNSEEKSHSVLATLERCRTVLLADADIETAELVTLAILQLRMRLNRIAEAELRGLCDAMMRMANRWLLERSLALGRC